MPCLHSPLVSTIEPSGSRIAWAKNESGCCFQKSRAFAIEHVHQGINVCSPEAPQKIASGGGIGDTLCAQDIEVGFVVAEQFQVIDGFVSDQEVVCQIEDMVGFKIGHVSFEQMQVVVDRLGQTELLDQQKKGSQASAAQPFGL